MDFEFPGHNLNPNYDSGREYTNPIEGIEGGGRVEIYDESELIPGSLMDSCVIYLFTKCRVNEKHYQLYKYIKNSFVEMMVFFNFMLILILFFDK